MIKKRQFIISKKLYYHASFVGPLKRTLCQMNIGNNIQIRGLLYLLGQGFFPVQNNPKTADPPYKTSRFIKVVLEEKKKGLTAELHKTDSFMGLLWRGKTSFMAK